jgi:tRNA G18 (ribose-2'-O)-methylase SpoU
MRVSVTDVDDERLGPYRSVGDARALEGAGLFVAEGRLVVERLLESGRFEVHSVAATSSALAALAPVLERRADVPVYECAASVLRAITGFDFHRGCLALGRRREPQIEIASLVRAAGVLALEGVADPDNVGALFRTAFAFGVDAVIIDAATADPLYRKAIRTSMAATLRVPFVRCADGLGALATLRAAGLRVVGLTPHPDAVPLADYAARADDRVALVVGSEGFGMSAASLAHVDVPVRIPIDPRADSLNVVTAAGIALYMLRGRLD